MFKCERVVLMKKSDSDLIMCSDLYKNKLQEIKEKIQIGDNVRYKGKLYIVIAKRDRFVDLQGENLYGTTVLYDDFIKRDKGSVIYG